MYPQSSEFIFEPLEKFLKSNSKRSFSSTFKKFRNYKSVCLIGDYPLLSFILKISATIKRNGYWNRNQVLRAVRESKFYIDEERVHAYIPFEWLSFIKDE